MCPGIAVLGGGAGSGGSGGKGAKNGGGNVGAGGQGGADGTTGDGRSAGSPDPKKYPHCGTRSCPVDVATGRVFTLEETDLDLPGPLPLRFFRVYSSAMRKRDTGLGYGWGHSFGWEIEVRRNAIRTWNDQGAFLTFDPLVENAQQQGRFGWVLHRHKRGFVLDTDEGILRHFEQPSADGKRYRLSRLSDRNGNTIELSYNHDGHLEQIVDSVGRIIRTQPDRQGRITALQVRNAETRGQWVSFARYEYDAHGHLLAVMDGDGFSNRYAYTSEHRLTENGYKCGIVFHFTYDTLGRCTESWGAYPNQRDHSIADDLADTLADEKTPIKGVHHCRYDYMEDGYTEVHDSTRTTRYQGNALGLLDKTVIGSGVTSAEYRPDGFVLSETDELSATTSYERDERGRLLRVIDPLGHVTTYDRDGQGLVTQIVDPEGKITQLDRDERGNIIRVIAPDGSTETRQYDQRGQVTALTAANGATTHCHYDAHGNLARVELSNGGQWQYSFDNFGNKLSEVDPTGAATTYSYSTRGDLLAERTADGGVSRYSYDGDHQVLQHINPKGTITKLVWAGLHQLVARIDANGNTVQLRYNHEGELLAVYNEAGEAHLLHRDANGLVTGETTFDGRRLRYTKDLAGRTTRIENGAYEVIDLTYDSLGNVVSRMLDDGEEERFAYNARGEIITATNAACVFHFERDALGRVVRESQRVGDELHWVETSYDGDGERIGRSTSLGHHEQVVRDSLGARQRTVLDGAVEITHRVDALGRETMRQLAAGGRIESRYDALGRLTTRTTHGSARHRPAPGQPDWVGQLAPTTSSRSDYRYDLDGELAESYDTLRGGIDYRYDPIGQLLARVPERARQELFCFDKRGNVAEANDGAAARIYGAGNRLIQKGSMAYVWDDDGRLIEKRTTSSAGAEAEAERWRYRWTAAGLLERVECPDGSQVCFAYDPFARRVSKTLLKPAFNGVLRKVSHTRFVWDGDVLAHEIRARADEQGDPVIEQRTYLFEDDSFIPFAQRQSDRWTHYVNNQVGTPQRLVDDTGASACELGLTAWGRLEQQAEGPVDTPFRLQGQYADGETGLSYNRWRYYDPDNALFISADPWRLEGSMNSFMFAPNTSTWVDPLGLAKRSKSSGKKRATDIPSWVKNEYPSDAVKRSGESGKDVARRLCDAKYGAGSYKTGSGSDYSKIKKYFDRRDK